MKDWIRRHPELAGLLLGLADAPLRLLAALAFAPADGRVFGPLLLANVHHHNEVRAFGWTSMDWFGVAAITLALMYAGVRFCDHVAGGANAGFRASRGLLAIVAGVLLLNALESAATGKVTDFIGWVHDGRFTAVNLGDIVLTVGLVGLMPAMTLGYVAWLRTQRRGGCA